MEASFPILYLLILATPAFGLIVGSFANVVIHRLPLEQSVVFPPSRCPRCGASIRPWQNIPVISWVFLLGRCASCRAPISARYPAVEALHGVGFTFLLLKYGPTAFLPALLFFYSALIILALIDWDVQLLPNAITLPGVVIGLAASVLPGALVDWREATITAVVGYLSFAGIAKGYLALRGIEGLGEGDWKLAAFMGAFLGGQRFLLAVFIASVTGMVYGLIQAMRLRASARLSTAESTAIAASVVPMNESTVQAETSSPPADLTPVDAAPESSLPPPSDTSHPVNLESPSDLPPIGLYKLPFGTFLAGASIVVLFFGEPILYWYRAQMRG